MTIAAHLKVSALLLLSLGTILFFNWYERYVVTGPELVRNASFHALLAEWKHSGQGVATADAGIVELHSDDSAATVHLTQAIPGAERFPLLRLECDVETRDVTRGPERWMTARVVLLSHDRNGAPMYYLPHTLTNLRATHEWEHRDGVFAVNPEAATISLSVQLAQATGTMRVKNLSLRPVTEKASYRTFRNVATLLWVAVSLWVTAPLVRSAIGNASRTVIIALGLIITFGTLMPENLKEYIGNTLFPSLVEPAITLPDAARFQFVPLLSTPDIYKAGHFILFALLAIAVFIRNSYQASRYQMLSYLLIFAFITEVLQLLVTGRSARLGDLLIDAAGIGAGLTLLRIMRFFSRSVSAGKASRDE